MWKLIMMALAIFVLYKFFMTDKMRKSKDETKIRDRKIATGEMVKDPVCGAYVEVEGSLTVRDGNAVHRFCSYECRKKFLDRLQDAGREIPKLEHQDKDEE